MDKQAYRIGVETALAEFASTSHASLALPALLVKHAQIPAILGSTLRPKASLLSRLKKLLRGGGEKLAPLSLPASQELERKILVESARYPWLSTKGAPPGKAVVGIPKAEVAAPPGTLWQQSAEGGLRIPSPREPLVVTRPGAGVSPFEGWGY